MFFKNKHSQKGMTLIEVAMVLAIAAVVIGGVMTLYLSTSTQRKTTDTVTGIVSIIQGLNSLYQSNANGFTGLKTTTAGEANIVKCTITGTPPAETASCLTPFGGTSQYFFGVLKADTTTNISPGVLALSNIPIEACIGIAKGAYGSVVQKINAVPANTISETYMTGTVDGDSSLPGTNTILDNTPNSTPVDPAAIVQQCSDAAGTGKSNVDVLIQLQAG